MDVQITKDARNEMLNRRELEFVLQYTGGTPSRMQIIGKFCALLNTKENQIVIGNLKTEYGKMEVTGTARIYDSEEARTRTERPHLMTRGMPKAKEEGAA
jgi:small subunit ribosomal protein S24e